ncbi:J domain-containing protein [Nodosilinea sp. LEGE 07088]|uniref:DnaJ C-terminal domain-containing protein n=1 Tax=Nodosilinea sp. LEGE 07088 TaxID=2777968 RepID=UPI00187EE925|nr:J domain-containing protein [Nodosilinea sp. LEGE 07088]MBE9140622.1 J domain-containing protein [Nodosilinea sp. LEGE 07088]
MENFRNYYDILGVSRAATFSDIKQAYRQLARQYHPDLNPGDQAAEDQFKLLSEAYTVLSDDEKRAQYEKFSEYWQQEGFKRGPGKPGVGDIFGGRISLEDFGFGEFPDFNVFVDQLLNRRPNSRRDSAEATNGSRPERDSYDAKTTPPGRRDAEADLTVPLEKAFRGGRERIRLEDGRSLEVNMPAGMVTGQRIRLRGQGVGGGNLYLRIQVDPHPFYTLQGNDIYCRVPVTPSEAALGSTIDIPTLDGPVRATLPQGTQTGQIIQLSGRGYPVGQERRGDQIVELEVVVPTGLSDREKALYEELRQTERFRPRASLPD